jgi:pyruvate,water dikinase
VTTVAFQIWLYSSPSTKPLLERLATLSPNETEAIQNTAALLRHELAALAIPEAAIAAIRTAIDRHPNSSFAVRSSATTEDQPGTSFAGQHDSVLNVRGPENVLDAVRRCWISLFNERSISYRLKNGLALQAAAMGVVVQEFLQADTAGVMFTADPISGDDQRVIIESTPGIGEPVVSGTITPEQIIINKAMLRSLKTAAIEGREDRISIGATRRQDPHSSCSLSPEVAARLVELGRKTERLFGAPQDVEWAVRNGKIFLLQARPITRSSLKHEPEIWTNANVVEALPDVVTPLAWSVMGVLMREFIYPIMRRLGLEPDRRPLVDLIAGRAYMNARAMFDFVGKGVGVFHVNVTEAFGGMHSGLEHLIKPDAPRSTKWPDWRELWRMAKVGGWLLPGLFRQQQRVERWRDRILGDLASRPPASLSDEQLAEFPLALLDLAVLGEHDGTWAAAVWMAIAGVGGSAALFHLTRKWFGDSDGRLANLLLSGAQEMNSAENGLALLRLAAWSREHAALKTTLLEPGPFTVTKEKLSHLPLGSEFLRRWDNFMNQHGHQARGGMDIFQPRWSEMPDFVLDMLRVYLQFDAASDPLASLARQAGERRARLTECQRRLRNPFKRWLLGWLIRISQRGLAQRENVKNEGVRMVARLRRAALDAGGRLAVRGVLRERDDVFFLRFEELRAALIGPPGFDVASAIASRKAEDARHRLLNPPPVIVGSYDLDRSASGTVGSRPDTLRGLAVSPGIVTGKARVILQSRNGETLLPGEILVAPYTDPGWTPYFLAAAGLVVDVGGLLSHGSVVAREYGLPAVVNVGPATTWIKTGQRIRVDGFRGEVVLLD